MPVSPAAFQQTVWNPVLDPTTLTRGAAPAGPVVIPLNVQLNPDTGMATQSNFQSASATYLSPGYRFATLSSPRVGLNVNNTQGIALTPGTYRVTIGVVNFVQQTTTLSVRIGTTGTNVTGAASTTIAAGAITGDGTYTADIVIVDATSGQGVYLGGTSSGCRMDFAFVGYMRTGS